MKRIVAIVAFGLAACLNPPRMDGELDQNEIEKLRNEAQALVRQQRNLIWEQATKGTQVNLGETYRGHADLFSKQTVNRLLYNMGQTQDLKLQRAYRYLRRHLVSEIVNRDSAEAFDALEAAKLLPVKVDDKTYSFRAAWALLASEPDSGRRRKLDDALNSAVGALDSAHAQVQQRTLDVVKGFGFQSAIEFSNELRGTDVSALGRMAEKFLADSDALYLSALKAMVKAELNTDYEKLAYRDLRHLFSLASYDVVFDEGSMLQTIDASSRTLGFSLSDFQALSRDFDKRSGKSPRAVAVSVAIPSDVRLAISPRASVRAYENAQHETAQALLDVHSRPAHAELAMFGDAVVGETYGFLWQSLLGDPLWLKTFAPRMNDETRARFVKSYATRRLYFARRYAAKLLFEIAWYSGQTPEPAKLYQNLFSRAYGVHLDEQDGKRWAADMEAFFDSIDHLRAVFLAAALEDKLRTLFGERWFEHRGTTGFLIELFALGREPNADELASRIDAGDVSGDALNRTLKARLQ